MDYHHLCYIFLYEDNNAKKEEDIEKFWIRNTINLFYKDNEIIVKKRWGIEGNNDYHLNSTTKEKNKDNNDKKENNMKKTEYADHIWHGYILK